MILPFLLAFAVQSAKYPAHLVQAGKVRLSVVDYGGKGPELVLIPGFNETPYIYLRLGPALADRFHVIAYSRRGTGDSDKPKDGYDSASLATDLTMLLDSLKIRRATLIGHSLAGDELTLFAGAHPERVDKLVYLDAAYDRGTGPFAAFSKNPILPLPKSLTASMDAYRTYMKRMVGAWDEAAEANMKDRVRVAFDGVVEEKTSPEINTALMQGTTSSHPDLSKVTSPALGLFVRPEIPHGLTAEQEKGMRAAFEPAWKWYDESFESFRKGPHRKVKVYSGGSHWLFIDRFEDVLKEIRAFI